MAAPFVPQPRALQEGAWEQPAPASRNQTGPSSAGSGSSSLPSPSAPPSGQHWGAGAPGLGGASRRGLQGVLTLAPHPRLTWLWELRSPPEDCQGMTSSHNPSVLRGPRLPGGRGEQLQGRVSLGWERRLGLSLGDRVTVLLITPKSHYPTALLSCNMGLGWESGAEAFGPETSILQHHPLRCCPLLPLAHWSFLFFDAGQRACQAQALISPPHTLWPQRTRAPLVFPVDPGC